MHNAYLYLKQKLIKNKKELLTIFFFCFTIGIIAHGYFFFNNSLSHDSLNEFYNPSVFGWKISLGRFFIPLYKMLTSPFFSIPLINGLLGLIWISLSCFFICKTFDIKSKLIQFLTSAILVTNLTNTAQIATYIHDFDGNMLALLLSSIVVYILVKHRKYFLLTIPLVSIVLSIYQSYFSVILVLISLYILIQLLNGVKLSKLFSIIIKTIISLFLGGILYFVLLKIVLTILNMNISTGGSNTLDRLVSSLSTYIYNLITIYKNTIYTFIHPVSSYSSSFLCILNLILLLIFVIVFLILLFKHCNGIIEKILSLILLFSLPVLMNTVCIFVGWGHDLMQYAMWLIYFIILLICGSNYLDTNKFIKFFTIILIFIVLWNNILVSNTTYIKKDFEKDANLSLFTRIIYSMENIDGYIPGETPVVFIGTPSTLLSDMKGFEQYYDIIGSNSKLTIGAGLKSYYQSYFEYVLQVPIKLADNETWNYYNYQETELPSYPEKDSIIIDDNLLIVNFK